MSFFLLFLQYPSWLNAVPKSQHISRICINFPDFYQQASVLKFRFLEKGYSEMNIDDTIAQVGNVDKKGHAVQEESRY